MVRQTLLRSCLTAMAALMCLNAAEAREIKGALAYRERIALPETAELLVEVREGDRILAELRATTGGAQVPLPFVMDIPDGAGQVLTGALRVDGQIRWISEPQPLAEGAVDLGIVQLTAHTPQAYPSRLDCGGQQAVVGFVGGNAVLTIGTDTFTLLPVPAASGAKFSDGATPETVVWTKGDGALITLKGTELPECTLVTETLQLPFVARGNEPGWVLNVTGDGVSLSREDGGAQGGPLPQGEDHEAGTRYVVSPDLAFTVSDDICHDTMTGMPFPATVLVEQAGAMLNGCGGDPLALLKGDWRVTRIGEADVPADVEVSMAFDGAQVSGASGCNRYMGGVELTGESFRFGPAAGTMMACEGPGAEVEQSFLSTLARIDRFDIGPSGELMLIGGDVTLIVAAR